MCKVLTIGHKAINITTVVLQPLYLSLSISDAHAIEDIAQIIINNRIIISLFNFKSSTVEVRNAPTTTCLRQLCNSTPYCHLCFIVE